MRKENKSTTKEIAEGLKEFAKYGKEQFNYDISLKSSLNPDTFKKIFGSELEIMNVAIKNMEMPRGCQSCRIGEFINCQYSYIAEYSSDYKSDRHEDCPLVEIVTCQDCVYGVFGECKKFHHYTMKDDFCSFGKRRE